MPQKYKEYTGLNLPIIATEILKDWDEKLLFELSVSRRENCTPFVFYEGPPSANGLPGIHHVMGRAIKDIFCRYKTLKGFQVKRKAGWDTHGLPVELGVEKELGITKEDIGKTISVDEYNQACKNAVMRYTDIWNDLTTKMGYWVDKEDPYITYETKYMESVWWLIGELYKKDLMYKGYTIQPYSPKAGTGLSSHELNQPGCYKDVKDTSVVAMFKVKGNQKNVFDSFIKGNEELFLLAWTTTPWTLPSNTALAVGENIEYYLVSTYNQYTFQPILVILAKNLVTYQFGKGFQLVEERDAFATYIPGDKSIPYFILGNCLGKDLIGLQYEQLLTYCLPTENPANAFQVIAGDFVTTEDGTGIVHLAPTFGADDARVAAAAKIPAMLVRDEYNTLVPLVDLQGKFRPEVTDFAGMYVKNEFYEDAEMPERSVDVQIAIKLKEENKAFKVEKYEHSYPHCWRTDKPILYYPLDSWFIRVSGQKEKMVALNNTINWNPTSTGQGRFGKWLENANDWNLSRSRYWGIPIPIWATEDGKERRCISSLSELKMACEDAVEAGVMKSNPLASFNENDMSKENYAQIDIHKHQVDKIVLVAKDGTPMKRELDLIDVWFDSGAMPYAQWHYPFENKSLIDDHKAFPADFIAEGVDQTRGWFYTLHAISTLVFGSVAYKNVLSNGLVLDKNGLKMSKRLGNGIDPFATLEKYGPDATRWYMITNAQPWDNLKFDVDGIVEVQRKFFGTLYNTYSFFALYANIDGFRYEENEIDLDKRPEIDRWIISKLNSLISDVDAAYESYEPTKAGRLIQEFVSDQLSNWYVRLCRRRFWKSDDSIDKLSAYQTLYTCLEQIAILASPIAPFFMDRLFMDLNNITHKKDISSVHLCDFPISNKIEIDASLEGRMLIAQRLSSLVLGLRKKEKIRVRQPLARILVPALSDEFSQSVTEIQDLILSEVNVKSLSLIKDDGTMLVKNIRPNFKTIGKKFGAQMKGISAEVANFNQDKIRQIENEKLWEKEIDGVLVRLELEDFEITAKDIPGLLVASDGELTVALDITITEELHAEGIAREFVNRIQALRKEKDFDVTDKIIVQYSSNDFIEAALEKNRAYICAEVLAEVLLPLKTIPNSTKIDVENEGDTEIYLQLTSK
jgi:isoleucyl-tRNA synthetase